LLEHLRVGDELRDEQYSSDARLQRNAPDRQLRRQVQDLKVPSICGKSYSEYVQNQLFVFTSPTDTAVTVTHTTSPYQNNTAMFVMRGSCHSNLCIADSTASGSHQSATFEAEAGVTYYIDFKAPSNQPSYEIWASCE